MKTRTTGMLAVLSAGLVIGTAVHVHAAEIGLLEMLFGARPTVQPMQTAPEQARASRRSDRRLGLARHHLRTRYAALPVKIRVGEKPIGDRQVSIDMRGGAAAALMKDETLRPGDIVVLKTGARVFTGDPDRRHAMTDFEPVQRSAYVSKSTRKLLAWMLAPIGALPADEARRITPHMRPVASESTAASQAAAMRVINPWTTNP